MSQLPLPLSLYQFRRYVLDPALALLPASMDSPNARRLLTTICLQESDDFKSRRQYKNGPARGLAQFEKGGGVAGVLTHKASKALAAKVCAARGVPTTTDGVYAILEHDDVLALALARLLLWTDPAALPGDEEGAWRVYLRVWRPGAYKRDPHGLRRRWTRNFKKAGEGNQ